ncbi:MAG TPA: hypothetical protein VLA13_04425 [Massilibacterium sp.]|nr:hypothetical protein [Massilibacterium sp.]
MHVNMIKRLRILINVILLIFLINCSSDNNSKLYIEDDLNKIYEWEQYFTLLGKNISANKTIVLLVRSIDCEVYKSEIKWWDRNFESKDEHEVVLIILEKYNRYYNASLSDLDVELSSIQDKNYAALNNDLVPYIPSKILIDRGNDRLILSNMGTKKSINDFLEYLP